MKLLVDVSRVRFSVTKAAVAKTDQARVQKTDRVSGEPLWVVQVMALDETGGEVINVTLAGALPKLSVDQAVATVGLEAIPWATGGRNGVAYRASALNPAGPSVKPAAA